MSRTTCANSRARGRASSGCAKKAARNTSLPSTRKTARANGGLSRTSAPTPNRSSRRTALASFTINAPKTPPTSSTGTAAATADLWTALSPTYGKTRRRASNGSMCAAEMVVTRTRCFDTAWTTSPSLKRSGRKRRSDTSRCRGSGSPPTANAPPTPSHGPGAA